MVEVVELNRRKLLKLFAGATVALSASVSARADDDEGDSGEDGGGNSSSGGGGEDGEDNSGDDEDNGGNDDGNDDSGDSGKNNSGSGSSKSGSSGSGKRDQDRVKDAVKSGDAIPLSKALALLKDKYDGRVIEVLYAAKANRIDYRFKILDENGKIISVTMDARTGRIRGFLGF